ncbi:CTLH/CRA C-terminal to lish motif domain-containing protein [Coniochaeta sp. 2T2.1]|nr:CTLH/CRA C-terminal to lish motif domain-containing protein [Coniochaeta sp. 2T2.1]
MSSLSEALNTSGLDINDVAFWDRVAAHFREKLGRMNPSSAAANVAKTNVFNERVAAVKSPKSDINSLILDYLVLEGYPNAAKRFSKEANMQERLPEHSEIAQRREIQNAIHSGKIEEAIKLLNKLDPEILDEEPKLHFSLLRLQLVELIRNCNNGDVGEALKFASEELGPRASNNDEFIDSLEKTMVLLMFPHESLKDELAALLRSDLRKSVADEVNKTIVRRKTTRLESAIQELARMRAWGESSARTSKKDLPDRIELGLSEDDNDVAAQGGANDEPMTGVTI